MKYVLTKKKDLKTNTWAQGTTTQLAIFPETATYQQFNFDFRISIATVEAEESVFTFMPGVTRHLMILKGMLDINHEGHYSRQLKRLNQDTFSGEWRTTAKGKVTDFNLMTKGSTTGSIDALIMKSKEKIDLLTFTNSYTGIYLLEGSVVLSTKSNESESNQGDFIFIDHLSGDKDLKLTALTNTILIISNIYHL